MSWVRIDDQFPEHPKALAAGLLGQAVHLGAICWSNRNLTDGFIPETMLVRLTGWTLAKARQQAALLVRAGFWHEPGAECRGDCPGGRAGGYQLHDYLDYQASKEDILASREAKAVAGRIGGLRSGETRSKREADAKHGASGLVEANAKQNAKQTRSKTKQHPKEHPKEEEDPPSSNEEGGGAAPPPPAPVGAGSARRKALTEADIASLRDDFPGLNVDREAVKFRDYLLAKKPRYVDHVAAFRNWLRRAEEDERDRLQATNRLAGPGAGRGLRPSEIAQRRIAAITS